MEEGSRMRGQPNRYSVNGSYKEINNYSSWTEQKPVSSLKNQIVLFTFLLIKFC